MESSEYNDGKVDPDEVWVPSTQQSKAYAADRTTLKYPEFEPLTDMPPIASFKGSKRYRRDDFLSKDDPSECTTQASIMEIEQWRFGPVLANDDTNSPEVGVLSVDVVRVSSTPLKATAKGYDESKQDSTTVHSGAHLSNAQTQPERRRKRASPSPRPFSRRLVQAPFRGK